MSTATTTKRRLSTAQVLEVGQWLSQNQGETPKTAETIATEISAKLGKEVAPSTIKKIAHQLGISLRRKHRTYRVRKATRLDALVEAVIGLYQLAGADDAMIQDVRSKLSK